MKISVFLSENFQFLEVKFSSIYLNRHVFVMYKENSVFLLLFFLLFFFFYFPAYNIPSKNELHYTIFLFLSRSSFSSNGTKNLFSRSHFPRSNVYLSIKYVISAKR